MFPSGGSSSPLNTDESAHSSNSTPPIGSHEEPCGNSTCFPLLLKHWEDKVEAETTTKKNISISFSPAPDFSGAAQPSSFLNFNTRKIWKIKATSGPIHHCSSAPAHSSAPRQTFQPSTVTALRPFPQPNFISIQFLSYFSNTFHPPAQKTMKEPHPFRHKLPASPQCANHESFPEPLMQRNKSSTSKLRRNPPRKAKSFPYIVRGGDTGKISQKRNHKSSTASQRTRHKAPEKILPPHMTAPGLFNRDIIPEVIGKFNISKVPQLPDLSNIHIPEVPKLHMPELPRLNLPEIPKMPVPELPILNISEIPKIALPDFYQIFNIHPVSQSAPVFNHAYMESEKEECEVTAESSASTTESSDSPGVKSWEWDA
ncbi:hypothetical protein E2C01_060857 [Portunus trituberculatus]|uniref:Uncharacterized protein n=1 Tax=Portunus trituberculatus TaxID=210409 RepID=A0A5B7HAL8_PORTR|nr:hypothetical protein [Portunus trituberculatus]